MSLASDSRKHAQQWFYLAERISPEVRKGALDIAKAWFRLAMDAAVLEQSEKSADVPTSNALH